MQINEADSCGVALVGQAREDFTLLKSLVRLLIARSFTMRLNDHMKLCYFFCTIVEQRFHEISPQKSS